MKHLISLYTILFLSSCAELALKNELSNLSRVQVGMTPNEVMSIMDEPNKVQDIGTDKFFFWEKAIVVFNDNKVINTCNTDCTSYVVEIESYSGEAPKSRVATVLPAMNGMNKDDLEFMPVKRLVENLLSRSGYKVSDDPKKIDTVVLVTFGISDPKTITKTFSTPVYDYVMPQMPNQANTTYNVYGKSGGYVGQVQAQTNYNNPYAVPQQIYRGERTNTVEVTTYQRFLILDAANYIHFNKTKEMKSFWKVKSISVGKSNDLRNVLPYMIMKSSEYIETDSGGKSKELVFQNDERVRNIIEKERSPSSK